MKLKSEEQFVFSKVIEVNNLYYSLVNDLLTLERNESNAKLTTDKALLIMKKVADSVCELQSLVETTEDSRRKKAFQYILNHLSNNFVNDLESLDLKEKEDLLDSYGTIGDVLDKFEEYMNKLEELDDFDL